MTGRLTFRYGRRPVYSGATCATCGLSPESIVHDQAYIWRGRDWNPAPHRFVWKRPIRDRIAHLRWRLGL